MNDSTWSSDRECDFILFSQLVWFAHLEGWVWDLTAMATAAVAANIPASPTATIHLKERFVFIPCFNMGDRCKTQHSLVRLLSAMISLHP